MNIVSDSFNNGTLVRLTDVDTGLSTLYHQTGDRKTEQIRAEERLDLLVEASTRYSGRMSKAVSFSEALREVITNGKGMICDNPEFDGDYFKDMTLSSREVIRVQWPTQGGKTQLPYLYVSTKYGDLPWTIDTSSPFARCRIVD